ncbi:MAG TPA: 2'-5' RNA ligase family protein [Pseudonocardiaceae bacterium]|nr:2'-5' RNA ligase family protein [Pseudonocardiaceae bacterium]
MSLADVRRRHRPAVLANQVRPADGWGLPCRAYLGFARPDPVAAAALAEIQSGVAEPALLAVPASAMHVMLVKLIPVWDEFDRPKDELWEQCGPEWLAALTEVAAGIRRFPLRFRQLAATDSAVIAVADEPNPFTALRRAVVPLLRTPGESSPGNLAHITLFRYATPLRDPAALLDRLAAMEFSVTVDVGDLLVVRETVFPCLDYDVLHRVPLAG